MNMERRLRGTLVRWTSCIRHPNADSARVDDKGKGPVQRKVEGDEEAEAEAEEPAEAPVASGARDGIVHWFPLTAACAVPKDLMSLPMSFVFVEVPPGGLAIHPLLVKVMMNNVMVVMGGLRNDVATTFSALDEQTPDQNWSKFEIALFQGPAAPPYVMGAYTVLVITLGSVNVKVSLVLQQWEGSELGLVCIRWGEAGGGV
jgi:hypothetical protein